MLKGWCHDCNVDLEVSAAGVPRRLGLLQRDAGGDAVQPPRPRPRPPAQPRAAAGEEHEHQHRDWWPLLSMAGSVEFVGPF